MAAASSSDFFFAAASASRFFLSSSLSSSPSSFVCDLAGEFLHLRIHGVEARVELLDLGEHGGAAGPSVC
jgi:hypothetical protein